ncbi:MAG: FAD-binding oxidoreductase [Deltaproteobacteria bacterium]|nr:FAD-binding oxidoreductase [Deltaproteobacteria bacterium]
MKPKSAVIIGAGVIGAFAAYFLLKKGWQTILIDQGTFGNGSSEGNCGLIVPNHVLPLNSYATLVTALGSMLKKDAPLHVNPRLKPDQIRWFCSFALKCGHRDIAASARGRHALLQSAFALYPGIIEKERLDCDWEVAGSVHAFKTRSAWEAFRKEESVVRQYGIAARPLNRKQLQRLEPGLSTDLYGGWHYPQTAQLCPEKLLEAMHGMLSGKGATIIENTQVTGFEVGSGRAMGVRAGNKTIAADAFVVATGAWAPFLAKDLGCRLPIQPGKGYSLTFAHPPEAPARACFFEEKSVVATPWPDSLRLGGTMEFSGFDDRLNPERLKALTRGADQYMRHPVAGPAAKEWCGFRPMTADGLPVIDWSPALENVLVAAGHNMLGLSMGPGTGRLVAEMVSREKPHVDPRAYRLQRFKGTP